MIKWLIRADAVVLLAAAGIDLALALGAAHVGREPGDDAPGAAVAATAGSLAVLVAIPLAVVGARQARRSVALLAPAAALVLTAFFYTEDPYYAPLRRRYCDDGAVGALWIYVVLGVAAAIGIVTRKRPRQGGVLAALWLVVTLMTTLLAGDGH